MNKKKQTTQKSFRLDNEVLPLLRELVEQDERNTEAYIVTKAIKELYARTFPKKG